MKLSELMQDTNPDILKKSVRSEIEGQVMAFIGSLISHTASLSEHIEMRFMDGVQEGIIDIPFIESVLRGMEIPSHEIEMVDEGFGLMTIQLTIHNAPLIDMFMLEK